MRNMKPAESTPLLPTGEDASAPADRAWLSPEKRGYVWMLSSALFNAAASVLVREAEHTLGLSPPGALLVRGAVTLGYAGLASAGLRLLLAFRGPRDPTDTPVLSRAVAALLAARAVAGGTSFCLAYAALARLPAGDAAAIFFTVPVFALLFGWLLVREAVTAWDALSALLSMCGVALIAGPWHADVSSGTAGGVQQSERLAGALFMLGAAAVAGLSMSLVRRLGTRVHCLTSVGAQSVGVLVAALLLGGADGAVHGSTRALLTVVVSATCAFAGQTAINRGLQLSRVGAAMLVGNAGVPLTYAVALARLGELPGPLQIGGGALVVSSGVVLALQKM